MKRRIWLSILVFALIALLASAAVACGGDDAPEPAHCDHDYTVKYDENEHWRECAICHDKTDVAAHTFAGTTVEPTYTEKGYTEHACDCGYTYRGEETERIAKVIVLAGQSNAVGWTYSKNLKTVVTPEEYEKYRAGFDNVKIFYSNAPLQADDAQTKTKNENSAFEPVKLGQGRYTSLEDGAFGPEIGLAAYLTENYPDETFYIIKDATGGATLHGSWLCPSSLGLLEKTEDDITLYNHLMQKVDDGMAMLKADGVDARILSFIWMQGENDAQSYAFDYPALWNNFIGDVTAAFEGKGYLTETGLTTIDGGITQRWTNYDVVNAAKERYAAVGSKAYFVEVAHKDWLTYDRDNTDYAHLDALSMIRLGNEFGKSFALAYADIYNEKQTYALPTLDGAGTSEKPYIIANEDDYKTFVYENYFNEAARSAYYKITADLGAEDSPLRLYAGKTAATAFAGTIDGNGKTIYIDLGANAGVGFIGYAAGATITDLTVGGEVEYTASGSGAGGLVGAVLYADGKVTTLSNCVNKAIVTANGGGNAGGMIGRSTGNISIVGGSNGGAVNADANYVGGAVGYVLRQNANVPAVAISGFTNEGKITAANNAGGLLGRSDGCGVTITNCANNGEVAATANYVGGAVGYIINSGEYVPSLTITDFTNGGKIIGVTGVGGVVGLIHSGTKTAAHALRYVKNTGEIVGENQVGGIVGTIGGQKFTDLTIEYIAAGYEADGVETPVGANPGNATKLVKTCKEHSFEKTSHIDATCAGNGYDLYTCAVCGQTEKRNEVAALPHTPEAVAEIAASYATAGIKAHYACSVCEKHFTDGACENEIADYEAWKAGDGKIATEKDDETYGTAEKPYEIANIADYKAFAAAVNGGNNMSGKHVTLTANIGSADEPITSIVGNANTARFSGTLDGDGHEVYVNLTSASGGVGLIGYAATATVKNLTVSGSVTYTGTSSFAGAIIGTVPYGDGTATTISGCTVNAVVTATKAYAGGILGSATGNVVIENCTMKGSVISETGAVGGAIGKLVRYDQAESRFCNVTGFKNENATLTAKTVKGDVVGVMDGNTAVNISYATAQVKDENGNDVLVGSASETAAVVIAHTAHTYAHVDGTAANCTVTGVKEHYKCTCGVLFTLGTDGNYTVAAADELAIAANDDHDYGKWAHDEGEETHSRVCSRNAEHKEIAACSLVKGATTDPTFDENGYTEYTCSVCSATYRKDITDKLVAVAKVGDTRYATLGEAIAAAGNDGVVTLFADGETALGEGQTLRVILGDYALTVTSGVDGKVVNSATVDGVTTYVLADAHVHSYDTAKYDENNHWNECSCGAKSDETAHTFTDTVTDPTCTAGGYTVHACECGYSHTDTVTEALGHNGIVTEAIAASYATVGTAEYYTCDRCSEHFADSGCDNAISDLEAWKTADGLIAAQKDDVTFANGETNPYTIANMTDYLAFATGEGVASADLKKAYSQKFFKLLIDIGTESEPATVAIGSANMYFAGTLDGNGKTAYVDLKLDCAAGFVTYLAGGTVKNLTVRGSVVRNSTTSASHVGGVVGLVTTAGGTIKNCNNYADVTTASASCTAGGIVGSVTGVATVANCNNYGDIVAENCKYVGGIVGYVNGGTLTLTGAENTGNVVGKTWVGGIVGLVNANGKTHTIDTVTVKDCEIKVTKALDGSTNASLGGVMGRSSNSGIKYRNWTVTNVKFYVEGVETDCEYTDFTTKTDGNAKPGLMFGSSKGAFTLIAE